MRHKTNTKNTQTPKNQSVMKRCIKQSEGSFFFFDQTIELLKQEKTINDKVYLLENLVNYQVDLMADVRKVLIDDGQLGEVIWFTWDYNQLHDNLCQLIYLKRLFNNLKK
jgi:hypothetical protein